MAQRLSPRRAKSVLSETNKERVRRLIKAKKMTRVGLEKIQAQLEQTFVAADDIISELKKDEKTWKLSSFSTIISANSRRLD